MEGVCVALHGGKKRVSSHMGDRRNVLRFLTEEAFLFIRLVACAYVHSTQSEVLINLLICKHIIINITDECNAVIMHSRLLKSSSNGFPPK